MSNKDKSSLDYERTQIGATSLRACLRGEPYPIDVTTASQRFAVPAEWKGNLVRIQADGGNLGYQVSTGLDATANLAARAGKSAADGSGVITLTPVADGVFKGFNGQWLDVQFPANALTFALIADVACVARCHLAES